MANVFISYSRDDRARAETIARTLEAEGYSVWWDPEIRPGETWDAVIDRELRAARCVIVAWSAKSVTSTYVRAEAMEADGRKVLVPVRLDATRLPVPFNLIQTEDFVAWSGDPTADCWQRVMLQVAALCGTVSDSPGLTPVTETAARSAPGKTASLVDGVRPGGSDTASSTTVLTLSAVGILGAAWWLGTADRSPVITATVILAALAFLLFRLAEDDLSPGMKAIARRWMLPVEGKVQVSAIEAFNGMFEAVFGRRHFSWFCLWRSAVASMIFFASIAAAADYFFFSMRWMLSVGANYELIAVTVFIAAIWNIFGDYWSLFVTRILLRLGRRLSTIYLPALAAIDFFLTGTLFFVMILVTDFIFSVQGAEDEVLSTLVKSATLAFRIFMQAFLLDYLEGWNENKNAGYLTVLYASLATAYLTSIWLWLALIFTPIVRLVVWSRTTGLTAVGRVLDAERKPMVALAYVTALLILACGGIVWGIGRAVAAFAG